MRGGPSRCISTTYHAILEYEFVDVNGDGLLDLFQSDEGVETLLTSTMETDQDGQREVGGASR